MKSLKNKILALDYIPKYDSSNKESWSIDTIDDAWDFNDPLRFRSSNETMIGGEEGEETLAFRETRYVELA